MLILPSKRTARNKRHSNVIGMIQVLGILFLGLWLTACSNGASLPDGDQSMAMQEVTVRPTETPTNTPLPEPTSTPTSKPPTSTPTPIPEEDIFVLLEQGRVEVEPRGSGIHELELKISYLENEAIVAIIPAGTFFVSEDPSYQNMVVRRKKEVLLKEKGVTDVTLEVACANKEKSVPGQEEKLTLQRYPNQVELEPLISALENAKLPFEVEQAAIWIITDDADYEGLGRLVTGIIPGTGSRVIEEYQAAQAMQIVDEAGIDIILKNIWEDRELIAQGLLEDDKKGFEKWIQEIEKQREEEGIKPYPGARATFHHGDQIWRMELSPDGSKLATVACMDEVEYLLCQGFEVRLWDTASGEPLQILETYDYSYRYPPDITWSPDGTKLAVGACRADVIDESRYIYCAPGDVRIWDIESGEVIGTVEGVTEAPLDIDFSPDGSLLAVPLCVKTSDLYECEASEILLWDVASGKTVRKLKGYGGRVYNFVFSPDSTMLASASPDDTWIWGVTSGEVIQTFKGHTYQFTPLEWSKGGILASTVCTVEETEIWPTEWEVLLWEPESGKQTGAFSIEVDWIGDMDWLSDGNILAMAYCLKECSEREMMLLEVKPSEDWEIVGGYRGPASQVDFSSDGKTLAMLLDSGIVITVDAENLYWQQ